MFTNTASPLGVCWVAWPARPLWEFIALKDYIAFSLGKKEMWNILFSLRKGFPGGASSKGSICQCRRHERHGFNRWVGKDPLEEKMASHSSILAWRIPWTQGPGGLQSMGPQRVEHNWAQPSFCFLCSRDHNRDFLRTSLISKRRKRVRGKKNKRDLADHLCS